MKYGRLELAKFVGLTGFQDIVEVPNDSFNFIPFSFKQDLVQMLRVFHVDFIQDCFALLVYPKPVESPVGYFLEDSQRELVADAVNAAILSNKKDACHLHSHLEMLLRQLTVCCLERRSMNGDQGETFRLHHVLKQYKKMKLD